MSRVTKKRNLSALHFLSAGVCTLMWYGVLQVVQWQNANPSWNFKCRIIASNIEKEPWLLTKLYTTRLYIIREDKENKTNLGWKEAHLDWTPIVEAFAVNILLRAFTLTWCNEVSPWNYNLVRIQGFLKDTKNVHIIVINLQHLLINVSTRRHLQGSACFENDYSFLEKWETTNFCTLPLFLIDRSLVIQPALSWPTK